MQLRWTEEAANDLERIADYLLTHASDRATELGAPSTMRRPPC
jgi:plasmid stabilization system protein ParE